MKHSTYIDIISQLPRVKAKHGPMVVDRCKQLAILTEELGEAAEAWLDGEKGEYKAEILDLIVAAIRVYEI